ncbi:MAG: glutamine--fructose-6-phosphate transaminase (isomerizing) [Pseudomonadales bacterium]|nr:glutamine--fructose-6-phosphate transaminase (isomerizing) [Pseudomonadales bacterium]
MCGIVGAVGQRQVSAILLEGLKRLEYRGYDSAGLALIERGATEIKSLKTVGKVEILKNELAKAPILGNIGIAHTRWATHGKPTQANAHPQLSGKNLALVHNGIIENHEEIKRELIENGYDFVSETDTEVIVHLIHYIEKTTKESFINVVKRAIKKLTGAYGIAVINASYPDRIIAARSGSPLIIGVGIEENFIASDPLALARVTDRFIYMEEGDIAEITASSITIWNDEETVNRVSARLEQNLDENVKGNYRHFMLKEIFEQPEMIKNTLNERINKSHVLENAFGIKAAEIFDRVENVQIVACGTSSHAGLIAKHWLESIAGIPCAVDIASEYRYKKILIPKNSLFVCISQSGETADTLAALRYAGETGYLATLAVCNVANSSLVREADLNILTHAQREVGVASTKAFTTQLVVLALLAIVLARRAGLSAEREQKLVEELNAVAGNVTKILELDKEIKNISLEFAEKKHALFLGRGVQYPVAKEGALKLKEISYIHAEAYPAGELKHGPLALVDKEMPVIAVAPNDELLEKLKSNLQEVSARGGRLYVFADENSGFKNDENTRVINIPHSGELMAPLIYTIPLQLLAYHVAVLKGTDVDQPRNLAKSVTVE